MLVASPLHSARTAICSRPTLNGCVGKYYPYLPMLLRAARSVNMNIEWNDLRTVISNQFDLSDCVPGSGLGSGMGNNGGSGA